MRQPCQRRASADIEFDADARIGTERAVDLFRRRGGDRQPGAGLDRNVDVEMVAAGHAACGIDDHGVECVRAGDVREAHA